MLLVSKDARPEEGVFYTACCALESLKNHDMTLDDLYLDVSKKYNKSLDYSTLVLSLDFLFLVNKVEIKKEKIRCI